jgi:hypothetical protein
VNPRLQVRDLYERYQAVLCCRVAEIDEAGKTVVFEVTDVCKGAFAPKKVLVSAPGEAAAQGFSLIRVGQRVARTPGHGEPRFGGPDSR